MVNDTKLTTPTEAPLDRSQQAIDLLRTVVYASAQAVKKQGESKSANKAEDRAILKMFEFAMGRKATDDEKKRLADFW